MSILLRGLTVALLLAAAPHVAFAGGPVQSLPKDGCWVKFFLEYELSGPNAVDSKGTGTWTVRSVGTKVVNGEKCRWIEIEEHLDKSDDEPAFTRWFKYLVREKDLKPGGDPLNNAVEYWHKDSIRNRTAKKLDVPSAGLSPFLRGTPKTVNSVAQKNRVLWQQGEFAFQRAEEQVQTRKRGDGYGVTIRDVVWKKAEIPFGTAAVTSTMRYTIKGKHSFTWIRKLSLADHGTGAKSKVPEAK
jgi:hypothetical protein